MSIQERLDSIWNATKPLKMPFDAQEPAGMCKLVGNPSAKIVHMYTPLWNNEITPNGLAQKGTTDFYNLEGKPMQPCKKILKFNGGPFQKSTRWH